MRGAPRFGNGKVARTVRALRLTTLPQLPKNGEVGTGWRTVNNDSVARRLTSRPRERATWAGSHAMVERRAAACRRSPSVALQPTARRRGAGCLAARRCLAANQLNGQHAAIQPVGGDHNALRVLCREQERYNTFVGRIQEASSGCRRRPPAGCCACCRNDGEQHHGGWVSAAGAKRGTGQVQSTGNRQLCTTLHTLQQHGGRLKTGPLHQAQTVSYPTTHTLQACSASATTTLN